MFTVSERQKVQLDIIIATGEDNESIFGILNSSDALSQIILNSSGEEIYKQVG